MLQKLFSPKPLVAVIWRRCSTWAALIAVLGLTYGCAPAPMAIQTAVVSTATTQVTLTPSPATIQEAPVNILPRVYGPPKPLDPGTYQTDPSFPLPISFTVPAGWYGGQGNTGFGIGQGLDTVRQDFRDGGLYLDVLAMPLEKAVEAFQNVEGMDAGQPQTTELAGYPGVVFYPIAQQQVLLEDALGIPIDILPNPDPDPVIFVDVEGTTVIFRTAAFNEEGRRAVDQVLESFQFSP